MDVRSWPLQHSIRELMAVEHATISRLACAQPTGVLHLCRCYCEVDAMRRDTMRRDKMTEASGDIDIRKSVDECSDV